LATLVAVVVKVLGKLQHTLLHRAAAPVQIPDAVEQARKKGSKPLPRAAPADQARQQVWAKLAHLCQGSQLGVWKA